MARDDLQIRKETLPESRLQSLWKALDERESGAVGAGEFGRFLRLSAPEVSGGTRARMKLRAAKDAIGAQIRMGVDEEEGAALVRKLAKVEPASEGQLLELSRRMNAVLERLSPEGARTEWFRLFRIVDSK